MRWGRMKQHHNPDATATTTGIVLLATTAPHHLTAHRLPNSTTVAHRT